MPVKMYGALMALALFVMPFAVSAKCGGDHAWKGESKSGYANAAPADKAVVYDKVAVAADDEEATKYGEGVVAGYSGYASDRPQATLELDWARQAEFDAIYGKAGDADEYKDDDDRGYWRKDSNSGGKCY